MEDSQAQISKVVREAFVRVCADFTRFIKPHGFKRAGRRGWTRNNGGLVNVICFHRGGSTYGAPINYSVDIGVDFAAHPTELTMMEFRGLNGPSSHQVRDSRGYAYHLRFNALTGSTYDRCLEDLARITLEHGLPWFAAQEYGE